MRQILLTALLFGAAALFADTVELDDGSRIVGTIVELRDGSLKVETAFAGTLSIDRAKVRQVTSDTPRMVALDDGSRIVGTLAGGTGETATVQTEHGTLNVPRQQITALWQPGAKTPEEAAVEAVRPKWETDVRAGMNGSTGNSENHRVRGSFTSTLATRDDRLKFSGEGSRMTDEGKLTEKRLAGGIDFEHFMARKHSWYARLGLESDKPKNLDLRVTGAGGYGYYLIRDAEQELRGRLGLSYRHESWNNAPDEETVGLDTGLYHKLELGWATMINELTWIPSLADPANYLIAHDSSLDIPVASKPWSFRLGVHNDYNAAPPVGNERLDTVYYAEVVYKFR